MNRAIYKAFTLIEMLIVMGILVILMVVGVSAGRFAINRSNEIAHKNGATQLYEAALSHFTDEREFPSDTSTLKEMTSEGGVLSKYLDMGSFKGGSEATYYYFTNVTRQAALVCVTLGGEDDETKKGITCVGNGFNDMNMPVPVKDLTTETLDPDVPIQAAVYNAFMAVSPDSKSFWNGKEWGEVAELPSVTPVYDPCFPCANLPKDTECITGAPSYCFKETE